MKRLEPALMIVLACGTGVSAAQVPLMETVLDSFDGNQHDLVGPSDVSIAIPENERVLLAAGRRMIAHRVSDRVRQPIEEEKYDTDLQANELDETFVLGDIQGLLFVLTELVQTGEPGVNAAGAPLLRVYDATNPVPAFLSELDLRETGGGPGNHLRVIPEDKKLLVIRPLSVSIFDYSDPLNLIEGQIVALGELGTGLLLETCNEDDRRMVGLGPCVVQFVPASPGGVTRRIFFLVAIDYAAGLPENLAKGGRGIVAMEVFETYHSAAFSPFFFDPLGEDCPVTDPLKIPREYATRDLALFHDAGKS